MGDSSIIFENYCRFVDFSEKLCILYLEIETLMIDLSLRFPFCLIELRNYVEKIFHYKEEWGVGEGEGEG